MKKACFYATPGIEEFILDSVPFMEKQSRDIEVEPDSDFDTDPEQDYGD